MINRRLRLLVLAPLLGLVAFYAGLHFRIAALPPAVHPVTGRPIAGIATDMRWLDRPERAQEEAPELALRLIGISPGMVVADVGAGTGYMTIGLARLVGPSGRVYANDLQPEMLGMIREKVRQAQLSNVEIVQGTDIDARLPDSALDMALLVACTG
jgi:predicted methyltransferase